MGPVDTAQLPVETAMFFEKKATTVKKAHFVAGEYGDIALRIQGPAGGQRDRTSRAQNPELYLLGEAVKKHFNAAGGLWPLC